MNKQIDRFIDLETDLKFAVPAAETGLMHSASSNKSTFVYQLAVEPPRHSFPVSLYLDGPTVAVHGDDLFFLNDPWFQDNFSLPFGLNITFTVY